MRPIQQEELLTAKELACRLKRPVTYVYAMKRHGFKMVGRRATLSAALEFLEVKPYPRNRADDGGTIH